MILTLQGFPNRYHDLATRKLLGDIQWTGSEYVGNASNGVPIGVPAENHAEVRYDFVLWGDSHGMAIAEAVNLAAQKKGMSGLAFVSSSAIPLPSVYPHYWNQQRVRELVQRNNEIIELIERQRIKDVFLVARWSAYSMGATKTDMLSTILSEKSSMLAVHKKSSSRPTTESAQAAIRAGLYELLDRLEESGTRVWFVRQVPESDFAQCSRDFFVAKNWPWWNRIGDRMIHWNAFSPRRRGVDSILAEFDNTSLHVLDLCELTFGGKGQLPLYTNISRYRDHCHLSRSGAKDLIFPIFERVFDEISLLSNRMLLNGARSSSDTHSH